MSSEQNSSEPARESASGSGFTEIVGTLIDALYAVALPLIALELPTHLGDSEQISDFLCLLVEYAISFSILFSCWIMQRRVNALINDHSRSTLWLTAVTLMFTCLLPVSTALVFRHGDSVTVFDLRYSILVTGALTRAELVDLFFLIVVMALTANCLLIARLAHKTAPCKDAEDCCRKSFTRFALVAVIGVAFFLLPIQNRYACFILPVCMFFDEEVDLIVQWLGMRPRSH